MLFGHVTEQVSLLVFQVLKGSDGKALEDFFSDLPLDTPDVLINAPQQIKPGLLALLLNLSHLVVYTENDISLAEIEGLNLSIFTVLAVF